MIDFKAIKEQFSCVDVARNMLGLQLRQIGNGEYRGISFTPGPHHTGDALAVNAEEWYDHSAGIGGSVLDLVAFVKFGNNDKQSLREAAQFLSGPDYDAVYWDRYTSQRDKFLADVQAWHKALLENEQALEYLHSRRISDETIEKLSIGVGDIHMTLKGSYVHELRLTVPYLDRCGRPVYMASRRLDWAAHENSPKYHKAKQNDFLKNCPFGLNTLPAEDKECDTLCIGEGMFDAISLLQENYKILFSIGGRFGKDNEAIVLKEVRRYTRCVTCFDIDTNGAGQGFTCYMGRLFLDAGLPFFCISSYGKNCKDVSDYYKAGGDIQQLLNSAVNGYVFMSRRTFWDEKPALLSDIAPFANLSPNDKAKYLAEVKKFVFKLRKFLDPIAFAEVIETLCEYYPKDKVQTFANGPTAHDVLCSMRDSFLHDRNLSYHGSIKHGEYWQYDPKHGYWYRMSDADLQSELSEFFKHELCNKDIAQLSMMIRLMVTRQVMPDFNKKRVQVFTNGTLDLDTGTLREHSPDDFATWAHDFAYDEQAQCPGYDAFIHDVAEAEQSRIDFLDDLAAYALYEDCRLEKMFVLIGDGMNGKGVYLKTLEALFASSNSRANSQSVTNIQPCEFDKPTERITLEGSMLNIAHDINPNLKGCASYLKSITSGDTITGNYKFCDTRSFIPRTKIICSSNDMLKVNDDSFGMRRRLMFCKFAACFKAKPDVHMLAKLKSELPGIFNRVYRAYKALIERESTQGENAIRETIDQNIYMAEFTSLANPVAAFWAEYGPDFIERHAVPKADLFDKYREFCVRNSLFAGRENAFHRALHRVFQDNNIGYIITRRREQGKQPYYYVFSGHCQTS